MKVLKYFLLLVLLILVAGVFYVATLDKFYHVSRTKVINAPIEVIYEEVNNFKTWPEWSPWLEKDSLTVLTYGEKSAGTGASYSWKSENKEVGQGSMETLKEVKPDSILQKIKFISPFESESDIYWAFNPIDKEKTEVTWGMKGSLGFMEKAFMAMSGGMDKQVGPDYEKGLHKLDSVVQVNMKKYTIEVKGLTTHGGGYYLFNSSSSKIEEMEDKMVAMIKQVDDYVKENEIALSGASFSLYHKYDEENNAVIFSCAVPITERIITKSQSGIQTGFIAPFKAVKTSLKGNYSNLKEAWETSYKYLADNNIQADFNQPTIEIYRIDPEQQVNPAKWHTELYIPVKE